jgi:type VI protein secretion system component VasK
LPFASREQSLQEITVVRVCVYLLAFYVVIKGIEILQIALASPRQDRSWIIVLGVLVLGACIITAFVFVAMQDYQASKLLNISGSRNSARTMSERPE